jgi:CarD family transcriptional regulator, regulator of rRNA transcription
MSNGLREPGTERNETMFHIGEAVVHPGHGPGKVVKIEKLSLSDSDRQYYKIRLLDEAKMTVWVPVQDAEAQGVRCPVSRSRLSEIWHLLHTKPGTLPSDHKERYAQVREMIENGDVLHLARALRDLRWKDHHVRSLTIEGKRLYDKATKLLAAEIALVQGSDTGTVETRISGVLGENVASREAM